MDFIFGTPLWKLNSVSFDEKKITEEIFNAQRSDPEGLSVSNIGGYHSGYDFNTPLTNEYIRSRLEGEGGLDFPHRVVASWFNKKLIRIFRNKELLRKEYRLLK